MRLDLARVEHELLGVDHGQALALHLEEERRLDDVHADRQVGDAGLDEQCLDLARRRTSMSPADGATAPRKPSMPAR